MHITALISAIVLAAAPASERTIVLDECAYATAAAAAAAWTATEEKTPKIAIDPAKAMLLLRCNFATNTEWRVAWDRRGKWDLADARELHLDIDAGARPASMIIYFRSGDGWYRANFFAPAGRTTVTLRRGAFRGSGKPGGWESVETIRLCVLRDSPANRSVLAGKIRATCRPASLAVYRNDAGIKAEPLVGQYAQMAAEGLARLGLDCDVLDDKEVAAGKLAGKKIALLPLNSVLPPADLRQVRKFVAGGGKLIVFRLLPRPLGELLGVRTGREVGKKDSQWSHVVFQAGPARPMVAAAARFGPHRRYMPAKGTAVIGYWADAAGKLSKLPAVMRNENGFFADYPLSRHGRRGKDQLLLELVGQLWPQAWELVCRRRQAELGKLLGLAGPAELAAAAKANAAGNTYRLRKIEQMLRAADLLVSKADAAAKRGQWAQATDLLGQAQDAYARTFATSVGSRKGEFRAVWCHKPEGVAGMSWDQAAKTLAEAGFNAIIVNMCWGGGAAYPSKVLPMVTKADELARCAAAARKHSLALHVWKVNWSLGGRTPPTFRSALLKAGRLQQDHRGEQIDWLCPGNQDNRTLEREAMLEIVRKYPVAGIHFDYIRYPGRRTCYCPCCRKEFEGKHGKVANWPADVRTGPLKEKYLQFRRDNITALVEAVGEQARKIRPGVIISAAVFPDWFSARDGIGQDWRLWVQRGYLDFVCTMQYTADAERFAEMTKRACGWTEPKAVLMPGIGATLGQGPDMTLRQVLIARSQGAGGFVLFDYNQILAGEYLPLLRLGATATKTTWKPSRAARD